MIGASCHAAKVSERGAFGGPFRPHSTTDLGGVVDSFVDGRSAVNGGGQEEVRRAEGH